MSFSPTQRTLAELRRLGYTAQVVERWNQYAGVRQDLFGVIDVLAIRQGEILGVQACSGSNHAARVAKIMREPKALAWIEAGGKLQVWSWQKRGPRGKRKLWGLRRSDFSRDLTGKIIVAMNWGEELETGSTARMLYPVPKLTTDGCDAVELD